ncbi:MAG: hypothetical protein BWY70_00667 [Bacteroidetes bacterium ADurb.Bin408]|nr:MAG: hypothetical protein BWY70_00667 [Bacteroidetes bacterium ADurb.Bin408]
MEEFKYRFLMVFVCLLLFAQLHAQTLRLTAGTVCTDGIVSVPVSAENMQGIYGFTMRLHYDPGIMTYTGYNVLNPQLYGTTVSCDDVLGVIQMEKPVDTNALNINGYIYVLNFSLISSANSLLTWDSVFFYGSGGTLILATLINGAVLVPPVITQQPIGQNICTNTADTITFFIQTTDTLHQYRWQVSYNSGVSWLSLIPDMHYQGVQTKILRIIHPELNMHNNLYRCKISGACTLYSDTALLQVQSNIILQPHDTVIDVGGTAVFTAGGSGSAPVYLWEVSTDNGTSWSSDALFPAVTTPSITLVNPPLAWSGYLLRCIVGGLCAPPADTTQVAALWIGNMGINRITDHAHVNLYPNPVQSKLNLAFEMPQAGLLTLSICNINGNLLLTESVSATAGLNLKTIDTQTLPHGLYILHLLGDTNFCVHKKFVK